MFRLFYHPQLGDLHAIVRDTDGAFIPLDDANIDYQKYLQWLAEGNQPEPWQP